MVIEENRIGSYSQYYVSGKSRRGPCAECSSSEFGCCSIMDSHDSHFLSRLFPRVSSALIPHGLLLAVVLGALLCCLLHFRPLAERRKLKPGGHQLPPGSLGLPLLGETLQFAFFSTGPIGTPLPFFSSRLRRYGTIFKTHLLGRPTVVSLDPELSKFVLSQDDKLVDVFLPKFFLKILGPTIHLHGPRHHTFRELANLSVSANAVQKLHVDTVQEHFLKSLKSWQQRPSPIVDAQQQCKEWAFTYSVKYFVGLEHDDPTTVALMRDFFILPTGYNSIPINLPGTRFYEVLKARKRIDSTLVGLVRARILEARKEAKDFLDVILIKRADEGGEYYGGLHVADWISSYVLAAYENTAVLFANILKFLSENEHVVGELKRENFALRKSKKAEEKLTWDDYRDMNFTRDVVKESLRLGSIAQHLLRVSLEDIHFKDIIIPKGWLLVLNFSMVHFNSNYYPDPLQFDPWRWMDSERNSPDFLIAFGSGSRRCPGSTLTIFEASVFLHYLVTLYKWKRVHVTDKMCDTLVFLDLYILPVQTSNSFNDYFWSFPTSLDKSK
ncbi:hypothetical protein GOP47_0021813 [Adiantum capillus-veneris]|uniref:Cytochrome P450 n=1 Tax=Adiantum capillus-veneris TaxID=13818 RepID=A0A9D4Z873_ADICA|nr:hypothetical protein GOP47_0021813 [Adiantum capillus-veneris]